MIAEHKNVELDVIARLAEVARLIDENPDLQTDFIRGAYAVFILEMHDLGYLDDESFLLFMRAIHPTYYWELMINDEATQKMYLRCEYEARTFGAHRCLLPQDKAMDTVSYHDN